VLLVSTDLEEEWILAVCRRKKGVKGQGLVERDKDKEG